MAAREIATDRSARPAALTDGLDAIVKALWPEPKSSS